MKDHIFDELLRAERDRPLPVCPSNLEANVLRRIRLAADDTDEVSVLDWMLGLLPQKGVVFSVLTLAVLLTATSTMMITPNHALAADSHSLAANALDFGVFKETPVLNLDN